MNARIACVAAVMALSLASFASLCRAAPAETLAIVSAEQAPLRAGARSSAPQQALLAQGDALEIRGERADYLQVYDHRRERAGFVHTALVRRVSLGADDAPELLAVLRFLREQPGQESLGIAYAAAYLRAAPAQAIDGEPFDALGVMAERLARRASARRGAPADARTAAQIEAAAAYGVTLTSFEREGRMQLCYDGDAYRRVLALKSTPEARARAILGLTRHDCIDPALPAPQRATLDAARADLLERIDITTLPDLLRQRVRLRRAGVWAGLAFERERRGEAAGEAAERALQALAGVDRGALPESDDTAYDEAALRVNASRWAAAAPAAAGRLGVATRPGEPGQTCVRLVDAKHDAAHALFERCTYGVVWAASAASNAPGTALALAVQPLAGWRELWMFHRTPQGWTVDVLPPGNGEPELGVVEFAGWVPGGTRWLAARETRVDGRVQRRVELRRIDTLALEKQAERPEALSLFHRWQDPRWKRETVMPL